MDAGMKYLPADTAPAAGCSETWTNNQCQQLSLSPHDSHDHHTGLLHYNLSGVVSTLHTNVTVFV